MRIRKLENYHTNENTYLVYDDTTAFVVDPGCRPDEILNAAREEQVKIDYILITHCHYDHIEALEALRGASGAKLIAGKQASINIGDPIINLTHMHGQEISAEKAEIILSDSEKIMLGDIPVQCIYTPGHTNCSVCYLCEQHLFAGDTLFFQNVGRWDLPTGNEEELRNSIRNKLYMLDENVTVHPGHGDDTSIGYEKKFNFYVKA